MSRFICFSFLVLSCLAAYAQTQNNAELQKMYDEDQRSRMVSNIDWKVLSEQDRMREKRVYELIAEGKVVTGKDHYNTAMIFQHGTDTVASRMAVTHMRKALALDPTINKWLLAAAVDRDLMRRGQPQIYGTQYTKDQTTGGKWKRYTIDSTKVTDEERQSYGVETLAGQRIKEHNLNLASLTDFYKTSQSIDKTIELIKSEHQKGNKSAYNVDQSAINTFGYQLMHVHEYENALKVFKLNTTLYPTGFNTFDSYGECLLKLNRKSEAMEAYKKSLELNPKNENARKVIAQGM